MGKEFDEKYINDLFLKGVMSECDQEGTFLDIPSDEKLSILLIIRHSLSRVIAMYSDGRDGAKDISRTLLSLGTIQHVPLSTLAFANISFLLDCLQMKPDEASDIWVEKNVNIPKKDQENVRQQYLEMIAFSAQLLIQEAAESLCGLSVSYGQRASGSSDKPHKVIEPRKSILKVQNSNPDVGRLPIGKKTILFSEGTVFKEDLPKAASYEVSTEASRAVFK
jgi:hypothetical protein